MSDQEREIARGAYGSEQVVRPTTHQPDRCLRGHDLGIAGASRGWSHRYSLETVTCSVCWSLRDERASWCVADPSRQHAADAVPDW